MTYRFGEFDLDEQRCDCAGLDQSLGSGLWSVASLGSNQAGAVQSRPILTGVNILCELVGTLMSSWVPVTIPFEWPAAGESLEEFLENFPSVKRKQAIAALEYAPEALIASAFPAPIKGKARFQD